MVLFLGREGTGNMKYLDNAVSGMDQIGKQFCNQINAQFRKQTKEQLKNQIRETFET